MALLTASEWWADIEVHPVILVAKRYSSLFIAIFCIALFSLIFRIRSLRLRGIGLGAAFVALQLFVITRTAFSFPELTTKLATALLLQGALLVFLVLFKSQRENEDLGRWLADVLIVFFLIFVAVNSAQALTGFGYVPGNPRFFGTAAHPNFIGVQSALAGIALLHGVRAKTGANRLICIVGLVGALGLLFASGSRTGVLVFGCGAAGYFLAVQKFSVLGVLPLLLAATAVGFVVLYGADQLGESFDRGGVNTRAETIRDLLNRIYERPLMGEGAFLGFSENSFLRGWAAFGVLYPVVLVGLCASVLLGFGSLCVRRPLEGHAFLFFSLGCGLVAGSLLEAYLTDAFSLPILLFVLLLGPMQGGSVVPNKPVQLRMTGVQARAY